MSLPSLVHMMHIAHAMTLDEWLSHQNLSKSAFAAAVGVSPSTISRAARRITWPEASLAAKIVAATGGRVTPNDLTPIHVCAPERV